MAIGRNPRPVTRINDGNILVVTQFNTIKGQNFGEINIDKFLKKISHNINQYKIYDNKEMNINIYYKAKVYKVDDNKYEIYFMDNLSELFSNACYTMYSINTQGHKYLQEKLDILSNITSKHDFERKSYTKIEGNNVGTTNENIAYLKYLKRAKKYFASSIYKRVALLLSLPIPFLGSFLSTNVILAVSLTVVAAASFVANIIVPVESNINGRKLFKFIRLNNLLRSKIKQITKKLNNSNVKIDYNETKVTTNKNDLYKDGMLSYIYSIERAIPKIKDKTLQKKQYLLLQSITNEYLDRMKEYNNSDNLGLTLDNTKQNILMDTIKKLQSIEMEIADIINHNSKNDLLTTEGDKLLKEIEFSINELDCEDKKEITTGNSSYAKVYKKI